MASTKIHDHSGLIPFVLFGIFAIIVAVGMYKGTHPKKVVKMQEDVLYVAPISKN